MADREPAEEAETAGTAGEPPADEAGRRAPPDDGPDDEASLREAVEAKYDFASFGPADMAQMSLEEWEAVFDPETWVTGPDLVDRVEAELRSRVAARQTFAVVERHVVDGEPRLLAYDDASYAVVHPDGTVEGDGSVRRDVEPAVALCSMPDYEVPVPPEDGGLPDPASLDPTRGGFGHRLLLVLAAVMGVAGLVVLLSPLVVSPGPGGAALTTVVGLGFLGAAAGLGLLVANARLSDRFRAAEYRERLLAMGLGDGDRPSFLPPMDGSEDAGEEGAGRAGQDDAEGVGEEAGERDDTGDDGAAP